MRRPRIRKVCARLDVSRRLSTADEHPSGNRVASRLPLAKSRQALAVYKLSPPHIPKNSPLREDWLLPCKVGGPTSPSALHIIVFVHQNIYIHRRQAPRRRQSRDINGAIIKTQVDKCFLPRNAVIEIPNEQVQRLTQIRGMCRRLAWASRPR